MSVTWHTGFSQWRPLFVDSRRQIGRSQNRSRMCEIHLTKLSCAAQQVGIVHFYAVTEIKGLSCRLWWMSEWRNLLTSTHVGYRSVIRAVASGASLKFGVQGASATNWFSRVNGAQNDVIRLYSENKHLEYDIKLPYQTNWHYHCLWQTVSMLQNKLDRIFSSSVFVFSGKKSGGRFSSKIKNM